MVAITCNVTVPLLGRDSFQEIDIAGVTMPITKHSYIVKNVKDLAKTLRNAFRIAKEGRPGPVLVDVTKDVTAAECEYTPRVPKPVERITASIKEEDIDKAVTLIKKAKKPYVFAVSYTHLDVYKRQEENQVSQSLLHQERKMMRYIFFQVYLKARLPGLQYHLQYIIRHRGLLTIQR